MGCKLNKCKDDGWNWTGLSDRLTLCPLSPVIVTRILGTVRVTFYTNRVFTGVIKFKVMED